MATESSKESGTFEKGTKTARFWAIAIILALLVLFVWLKVPKSSLPSWSSTPTKAAQVGLHFGPDKIPVTTEYEGCQPVYNEHGLKFVDGSIVDKNVPWEIQYDGDPAKRYPFPPYNAPGTNNFVYKQPYRYWQIRIMPNPERKTTGEYAFVRAPR